jgi:hypothetical protein
MTRMTRQKFLEDVLTVVATGVLIGAGVGVFGRGSVGTRLAARVLENRSEEGADSGVTVTVETYADETYYLVVQGFESSRLFAEQARGVTLWSAADDPLVCFPIPQTNEVGETAVFELSAELSRNVVSFDIC